MKFYQGRLGFSGFLVFLISTAFLSGIAPDDQKNNLENKTISREVFKERRTRFMKQMDGGIAIFPGKIRNEYRTVDERQEKYCYYLTGIRDQGVIVILDPASKKPYKLLVPGYRPMTLVWTGKR